MPTYLKLYSKSCCNLIKIKWCMYKFIQTRFVGVNLYLIDT